jgi:hypothetical protein
VDDKHLATVLEKIKHAPVILVQGDKGNLVPVAGARRWAEQMKKLGIRSPRR